MNTEDKVALSSGVTLLLFLLASFAGWFNHVITCLSDERYMLLIVGAIAAPIGVIHGWGLWFGFF